MTPVEVSDTAFDELRAQIDWLAERSPSAARRAAEQLYAAIKLLSDFPLSGERHGDVRRKVVRFGRDGYIIVYTVSPERVFIERVLHGRQDRPPRLKRD